jgi:hypothetical protein
MTPSPDLCAALQHSASGVLEEVRAERDQLARDLGSVRARLRGLQAKYSSLRYIAWRIAVRALCAQEQPLENALEQIIAEAEDSEDDRAWEAELRE